MYRPGSRLRLLVTVLRTRRPTLVCVTELPVSLRPLLEESQLSTEHVSTAEVSCHNPVALDLSAA